MADSRSIETLLLVVGWIYRDGDVGTGMEILSEIPKRELEMELSLCMCIGFHHFVQDKRTGTYSHYLPTLE